MQIKTCVNGAKTNYVQARVNNAESLHYICDNGSEICI